MVLACTKTISEIIMKENGFKIKSKGMENTSGIIKTLILASGRKTVVMVLVLQPPLMKHMRVILNLTYEKVMELAILNKESTKDTGIQIKNTDRELLLGEMEIIMKVNGNMICKTGLVSQSEIKLYKKELLKMINLQKYLLKKYLKMEATMLGI